MNFRNTVDAEEFQNMLHHATQYFKFKGSFEQQSKWSTKRNTAKPLKHTYFLKRRNDNMCSMDAIES